jgi:hypothetical protein
MGPAHSKQNRESRSKSVVIVIPQQERETLSIQGQEKERERSSQLICVCQPPDPAFCFKLEGASKSFKIYNNQKSLEKEIVIPKLTERIGQKTGLVFDYATGVLNGGSTGVVEIVVLKCSARWLPEMVAVHVLHMLFSTEEHLISFLREGLTRALRARERE